MNEPSLIRFEGTWTLRRETASCFAQLVLRGVRREYPHYLDHVINDDREIKTPKALHPAFYGCFDWHSSVHGHWLLVRLLRLFPELSEAGQIRSVLNEHLTAENISVEVDYFQQPHHKSFERMYGWAWLLKLAEELYNWDDSDGKNWSRNLNPLTQVIILRYLDFLPRLFYPIRTGVHSNTAFGLAFALDYARAVGHSELENLVVERSLTYFLADKAYPAAWEPGGEDFLSPCLMEADLMRRVLEPHQFTDWFHHFLPTLEKGEPKTLLEPVKVIDRSDSRIIHLDGLNLSRAWNMRSIASALAVDDPTREILTCAALQHAQEALAHVISGYYAGEHWLATFAVYLLSTPDPLKEEVVEMQRGRTEE
jgi:hypothetical protein